MQVEGNYILSIKIENSETLTSLRKAILFNMAGEVLARSIFDGESMMISDIKRGEYYLKVPSSGSSDNFFNYYYSNKILFNEAALFSLKKDTTIIIDLVKREDNNLENNGRINGILLKDQSQSRIIVNQLTQIGNTLSSTDLLLFDQSGKPIGMATSGENGQFSFVGLAPGLYSISLDIFGFEFNASDILLEVKESKPLNISIIVGENGDTVIKEVITSLTSLEKVGIKLFPNPVQNTLKIDLGLKYGQIESLVLVNISGAEVQMVKTNFLEKLVEMDLSKVSSGIYLILINSNEGQYTQKIIKK
jgi:hypothetical protein